MSGKKRTRTCIICGKAFLGDRKTCSEKCRMMSFRVASLMQHRGISFEESVSVAMSTPLSRDKKDEHSARHGLKIRYTRKCHDCGKPCLGYRCDACRKTATEDYLDYY